MFNMTVESFNTFEMSFMGSTLYDDSGDIMIAISNLPSVTSHCAVLIMDIYVAFLSSDTNSE